MKQRQFEQHHRADWQQLEEQLGWLESRIGRTDAQALADFPQAYRRLCQHLALARQRGYSPYLVEHLQRLALRGHQQLYRQRSRLLYHVLGFILSGFPRLVRQEWRSIAIASLLFYLPLALMGILVYQFPDLIYQLMPADQVVKMEAMYDPENKRIGVGSERGSAEDWTMFGFYIMNNIGIAFQTFASGLLFCLGSLFFLCYNGLVIGSVAGHLTRLGYSETFWSFVVGHSAFELTAITFAGAAGLKLGWALISPGRLSRLAALQSAAATSIRLVYGVILMLLLAAFVEAYWSSIQAFDPTLKYIVGGAAWLVVALYLTLAGRRLPGASH